MNIANRITISRIVLVPLFVACVLYYSPERPWLHTLAVVFFLIACISDALDGYLARSRNEITALGAYIDPLADKALLLSGFLSLSLIPNLPQEMHMPAWVTLTVISRDLLIILGSLVIFITTGSLKANPLYVGKITTVVQMLTLLVSLAGLPEAIRMSANVLTVFFTVLSGIFYGQMGGRSLREAS